MRYNDAIDVAKPDSHGHAPTRGLGVRAQARLDSRFEYLPSFVWTKSCDGESVRSKRNKTGAVGSRELNTKERVVNRKSRCVRAARKSLDVLCSTNSGIFL